MDHFEYKHGELYCEEVPIATLAEQYGTPLFVYSRATLERHWHAFDSALAGHDHLVCYAVKANSNLAVLNLLARLGSLLSGRVSLLAPPDQQEPRPRLPRPRDVTVTQGLATDHSARL